MTTIIMRTSEGDITINLFDDQTPVTVKNFLGLATGEKEWTDPFTGQPSHEPFYNGLTFHRIIKDFMIQGGCPLGNGTGGPGYDFDDEIVPELTFDRPYLLAMANAGLRRGPRRQGAWHQRLPILHHHRADPVARRTPHDLRRGRRRRVQGRGRQA